MFIASLSCWGARSEEGVDYDEIIEDNLNHLYERYQSTAAAREANVDSKGKKLSRKRRMESEAATAEKGLTRKLDYEHQQYLRLLAGAKVRDPVG